MSISNRIIAGCIFFFGFSLAQAQVYWGAVFADVNTGITGAAWDGRTEAATINGARQACVKNHNGRRSNCKLVTTFSNGCIGVYQASNRVVTYGTHGFSLNDAKARGAKQCIRVGGRGCRLLRSFCTSIPVYY